MSTLTRSAIALLIGASYVVALVGQFMPLHTSGRYAMVATALFSTGILLWWKSP